VAFSGLDWDSQAIIGTVVASGLALVIRVAMQRGRRSAL
jgi:hypothetical protein